VLLDGIPAHRNTGAARARRRRLGMAFQYPEDQLFERTVFREVAFALTRQKQAGWTKTELRDRVHWALEQVGLDPSAFSERSPLTLSGGEMRRVALAGVICTRPEVLILDEPTAGLDPQGRRALLANIRSWRSRSTPFTLIVVSHDLGHLSLLAERVIVLAGGRIAADGPAPQVLGDRDQLNAAGLRVPPPVELLYALRQAGWPVRTDQITPQQAAAEIARVYKHRGGR
jgi:energy-coupling factor transport system ATP-binding protein